MPKYRSFIGSYKKYRKYRRSVIPVYFLAAAFLAALGFAAFGLATFLVKRGRTFLKETKHIRPLTSMGRIKRMCSKLPREKGGP